MEDASTRYQQVRTGQRPIEGLQHSLSSMTIMAMDSVRTGQRPIEGLQQADSCRLPGGRQSQNRPTPD